jgi:dihydroorotate dehydrogenase electron transfer subunit
MKQFKAKIILNKKIAPEHYILSFKAPKIAKDTKPGQFFNVRVSSSYQPLLRRPFGAHKISKDRVEILYKVVGKATEILSKKKKGNTLDALGPLGNGFELLSQKRNPSLAGRKYAILVSGGHGVAPLYALAEKLSALGSKLSVFMGAKSRKHVISEADFKKLGAKVYISTDDGSMGYKGLVTDLLNKKLKGASLNKRRTIYACGPKPMLKEIARLGSRYKIPCQVSLEEYVACGIGTCMGCAVKTKEGFKLVCKDGPVFDAGEIVWT